MIQLLKYRKIIFYFAIVDIKIRFKNTYLGFLWAGIEPLLTFIVLYVVFTSIRDRGEDFAIYLITGVMLYHIFARGTAGGIVSLILNNGILKSLNILKEFFPVVAVVSIGILAFVDVGIFFALMPVFQFIPSWTIIFIPIILGLLLILILGISYFLSIITVFARDVQHIWNILVHTLIFISPIFWRLDEVDGILSEIQKINPLGQLIELAHIVVIRGEIPPLQDWLYTIIFILTIFFVGYYIFHKFENKIMEEL